jgi:phenylacetate-CoA ligase
MALFQRLVRDVIYPLAHWRSGDGAQLRYLKEFEQTQFLPPEQLKGLQLRRLRALLEHAYQTSPFYRRRFDAAGLRPRSVNSLDDLSALPPLEKHEIQEHRDDLIADGWPTHDRIPNQTGGSTGTPVSFLLDNDRRRSRAAATIRHNRWAGWDIGDKVAVLWGAPRDRPAHSFRGWLRNALIERQLFLDTGHVTEDRLAEFQRTLHRYRPRIVLAYARSATMFARYLQAQGLTVPPPRALVTSAEVLGPDDRALLESTFGCRVFNRYGCREVSVIASECEQHQGLHTMAEGLYVEVVCGDRPAAPGETGAILVTDLLNRAMPLIRYRIGDLGSWEPGDCPCGRGLPRLRSVAGRVTDFLVGADGRLVSGVFLATYLVAQRPSLGQVQICQEEAGVLRFRVRPGTMFNAGPDLSYLERTSREYLGADCQVEFEFVDELRPEPSGKFLFSRSTVTPTFLAQRPAGEALLAKAR